MIAGTVVLEDHTISFCQDGGMVTFTVGDATIGMQETQTVPGHKFFKALAIAVHNDGMPDYKKDYPDAEDIMGTIRWIP